MSFVKMAGPTGEYPARLSRGDIRYLTNNSAIAIAVLVVLYSILVVNDRPEHLQNVVQYSQSLYLEVTFKWQAAEHQLMLTTDRPRPAPALVRKLLQVGSSGRE